MPEHYDVFISYSHGATLDVARALETWLQRYARPWWRRSTLTVFRDETNLGVSPELWPTIVKALDRSDWLVLILSPQAAQSKWVKREIRHWLGNDQREYEPVERLDDPLVVVDEARRSRLLLVLVDGELAWQDAPAPGTSGTGDFDWMKTDSMPRCLSGVFKGEPGWADLREAAKTEESRRSLNRSNPAFMGGVAKLAATIRTLDLAALISEDSRLYRRAIATAWSAATVLVLLTCAVALIAWLAIVAARTADWQRQIASAERAAAEAQTLSGLDPAALPQAGLQARQAYLEMRQLASEPPAPPWMRRLLATAVDWGWTFLAPVGRSTAYHVDAQTIAAPESVMRRADELTPRLMWNLPADAAPAVHLTAVNAAGAVVFMPYPSVVRIRRPDGVTTEFSIDDPVSRINGEENIALSGDGGIVVVEAADHQVRAYSTATSMRWTIDPRTIFPAPEFDPRPKEPAGGGPIRESFRAGAGSSEPLLAGLALNHRGDRLLLVSRGGFARLSSLSPDGTSQPMGAPWRIELPTVDDFMRMGVWRLDAAGERLAATPSSIQVGRAPVGLWRAVDGVTTHDPLIQDDRASALAFSPNGDLLAVGLSNGTVLLYQTGNGSRDRSLAMGVPVESVAFGTGASDGFLLVGGSDVSRVFDVSTRREVARAPQQGNIRHVAWAPDGRAFLTAGVLTRNGSPLCAWDLQSAQAAVTARMRAPMGLERLVIRGDVVSAIAYPGSLAAWNRTTGEAAHAFGDTRVIRTALGAARDGTRLVTLAGEDGGLFVVRDVTTGARRIIPGPGVAAIVYSDGRPSSVEAAFDGDAAHLLRLVRQKAEPQCALEMWRVEPASRLASVPCAADAHYPALSADATRLGWIEGKPSRLRVRLVSSTNGEWSAPVPAVDGGGIGQRVVFSGDGHRVAVAAGSVVHIFDAASGKAVGTPIDLGATIGLLAVDRIGDTVVAALLTRRVAVASVSGGALVTSYPYETDTIGGGDLAISESDGMIYAVFGDGSANNPHLWRWRLNADLVAAALGERLPAIVALQRARSSP